jgi:hypothetical protein
MSFFRNIARQNRSSDEGLTEIDDARQKYLCFTLQMERSILICLYDELIQPDSTTFLPHSCSERVGSQAFFYLDLNRFKRE